MAPSEWHHTSKCFNKTNYYDIERHLAILSGEFDVWCGQISDEDYDAAAELIQMRQITAAAKKETAKIYHNCVVEWLEWPFAPGRGGNYADRRPKECHAENCEVQVKGQTATIIFADGGKMTKRLSTAGFSFSPAGREEVAC